MIKIQRYKKKKLFQRINKSWYLTSYHHWNFVLFFVFRTGALTGTPDPCRPLSRTAHACIILTGAPDIKYNIIIVTWSSNLFFSTTLSTSLNTNKVHWNLWNMWKSLRIKTCLFFFSSKSEESTKICQVRTSTFLATNSPGGPCMEMKKREYVNYEHGILDYFT